MALPKISVILPVRNEVRSLGRLLDQLTQQNYPADRFEILVSDGRSTDGTRALVEQKASSSKVAMRVVDNPGIRSGAGRNAGVTAASGDIILFIDGHCEIPSKQLLQDTVKLMEETEVPVRSMNDLQAQLQAAFEFQKRGKAKRETINTRHILFVVSGAFERLKQQVSRRISQSQIGFNAEPMQVMDNELFQHVTTQDFVEYGFEPEFIGRLPVRVVCEELDAEDLFQIMKYSEGSLLRQYERAFRAYGIEISFEDEALRLIAGAAAQEKTGARGLLTVFEKLFRDYKYHLAGSGISQLRVSVDLVREPKRVLERLMAEGEKLETASLESGVRQFADHFGREHGLEIVFDESAVRRLVERAHGERMTMPELCAHLFKDFKFGLSLIQKNMGQKQFVLDAAAVDAPDKFLSDLVVQSYYPIASNQKA